MQRIQDKGRRIEQRWYTCEECNQNWKQLQDNPKAKIMIKICEPCSYRCHSGHKGIRFIRSSAVSCMCLSTCKPFCPCNALEVSKEQLSISQAAFAERIEIRRQRMQMALMPPVLALVPRHDANGVFKRESGWMICSRAPITRALRMGLSEESVSSVDTDTVAESSQEHYSESVVGNLMDDSQMLLSEKHESALEELEDRSQMSQNESSWIEVQDPEEPVVLPKGTKVLCKRKGIIQKCYGTIFKQAKCGLNIVRFALGETETIAREHMQVITKPVFYFNVTTGQSYWKSSPEASSLEESRSLVQAQQQQQPHAGDQRGHDDDDSSSVSGTLALSTVHKEGEPRPDAPLQMYETATLCMEFKEWDQLRVISNVRRNFENYTEYEDPVTTIVFYANEKLLGREAAAMVIQKFMRTKLAKAPPIAWTTTGFTFDVLPEVYKEQKVLAGWAFLRRQSKLMGYFTDVGRNEWEEYMDPESSNFFYWQEEGNLYQWTKPEIPRVVSKKAADPLALGEEVRFQFPGRKEIEKAIVTRCRTDDETGGDCYDLCLKDIPKIVARWIPRYQIKKAELKGEDLKIALSEKQWKLQIKKQRDKEARNKQKIKAKRMEEEMKKRKKFLAQRMMAESAPAQGDSQSLVPSGGGSVASSQLANADGGARARIRRCKQEEDEIQEEKDKEYLEKRKLGVQKLMTEIVQQNMNMTRTELLNLQRALTLKLTLEDKLKAREAAQAELVRKREKVRWRLQFLEDSLRDADNKTSTPRSTTRRKILRRMHICMKRQSDGYIPCEWGCNDWVRVGQEQQDHQLKFCTKRIVGCALGCPLKCTEDEWLTPHQNTENLDADLAAEFAKQNPVRPPTVAYQQFHEENECVKRLKPCPRQCLEWATFEDMPRHLDYYCVKRPANPILCRLGCQKIFGGRVEQMIEAEDERLEHELEECEFRMVRCNWKNSDGSFCAAQVRCNERDKHREMHIEKMGIHCYLVPGTYIFRVPPRIFRLKLQAWGAGGGSGHFKGRGGGGGGGGAFVEVIMNVSPHDVLEIVVGSGGQAGVHGTEIEALETTEKIDGAAVDPAARSFDVIDASFGTALGGSPGGGEGYGGGGNWAAGGGGGYSMVAKRHAGSSTPLVVAAGGGGGSSNPGIPGGGMDGPLPGTFVDIRNGGLGTASAGGAAGDSGSIHNSQWPATPGGAWQGGNGE